MGDHADHPGGKVRLDKFDNSWFEPGRPVLVRLLWILANAVFLLSWFPWPSGLKVAVLRLFGAVVGLGVVVKPRVNVKYPWNLQIGDHVWIGEGVWLDSIGRIEIQSHACLSQGVIVETGNHDWTTPSFDLQVRTVLIAEGAWASIGSLLLPGSTLASHAVLGAGGVLAGETEPYGVYVGVPAKLTKYRRIGTAGLGGANPAR